MVEVYKRQGGGWWGKWGAKCIGGNVVGTEDSGEGVKCMRGKVAD